MSNDEPTYSHFETSRQNPRRALQQADNPLTPTSGRCSDACYAHGTCDEVQGKCMCPPGYMGSDCTELVIPSCTISSASSTPYNIPCTAWVPKPCDCARECDMAFGYGRALPLNEPCYLWNDRPSDETPLSAAMQGLLKSKEVRCVLAVTFVKVRRVPTPLEQCRDSIKMRGQDQVGFRELVLRDDGECEEVLPIEARLSFHAAPLERCPDACSLHGWCSFDPNRGAGSEFCKCFYGYRGRSCELALEPFCYNNCSGRGRCLSGFCHCQRGYFGVDCSQWIHAGRILHTIKDALPEASPTPLGVAGPPAMPLVYVYELPSQFLSWLTLLQGQAPWDGMRSTLGSLLLERLLCSRHRTTNPFEADFYLVPVTGRKELDRVLVAKVIEEQFPFWSRRPGVPDHLWITLDAEGPPAYFTTNGQAGRVPVMLRRKSVFLSNMGSTIVRVHPMGRRASPPFIQKQDILLPLDLGLQVADISRHSPHMPGAAKPKKRPQLLYFAGGVLPEDKVSATFTRNRIFRELAPQQAAISGAPAVPATPTSSSKKGKSDGSSSSKSSSPSSVLVLNTVKEGDPKFYEHHLSSLFCLAPPSRTGTACAALSVAALMGCIPVIVADKWALPFEELLPWDRFSVRIPEGQLGTLVATLKGIQSNATRVAEMQAELACASQLLLWSSLVGSSGETGIYDGFSALMSVLRLRAIKLREGDGNPTFASIKAQKLTSVCSAMVALQASRDAEGSLRDATGALLADDMESALLANVPAVARQADGQVATCRAIKCYAPQCVRLREGHPSPGEKFCEFSSNVFDPWPSNCVTCSEPR
eukprot:jgi/Mesvir1/14843/Mv05465-RA.1